MSSSRRCRSPILFISPITTTFQHGVVNKAHCPPLLLRNGQPPPTVDSRLQVTTAFRDKRAWIRQRHRASTRGIIAMSDAEKPKDERTEKSSEEQQQSPSSAENAKGANFTPEVSLPDLRRLMDGSGSAGCEQCGGAGQIECVVCEGKGMISITMMDTTSASTCRLCQGRRIIPCPSCRSEVFKSVLWWDKIPSPEEDPEGKWRDGPEGPRIQWGGPPNKS